MVDVQNLKKILLMVGTIISLFSLRDRAVVTTVINANPPVAEAYHAPAWMQPQPVSVESLIAPSTIVRPPSQSLNNSPSAEFAESDLLSQESYIVGNEPAKIADVNIVPAALVETPKTTPAAGAPATIIYGFTGMDSSSGTDDQKINTGGGDDGGTTSPQFVSKFATESNVFITSLTPNSGIPGANIVIQGAGFNSTASNNDVKFGTVSSTSVTYVSANQLRATVPQSGVSQGFTNVSVTINSVTSNKALFSVLKSSAGNVFDDNTQVLLPTGLTLTGSSVIALGDIDGDGDLDLFVVDTSSIAGAAYLLINNGQGHFTNETSSRFLSTVISPSEITDAVFGDVNKDGYPDILLTYSSGQSQSVRLLLNDGTGKFSDATNEKLPAVPGTGNAASVDLGDVDGDGAPDIIIANKVAKDVLLVNNGSGTFSIAADFNLPAVIDGSSDIRFADVNRDGSIDIVTTNSDVVGMSSLRPRVYINDGSGNFTDSTESESRLPDTTDNGEAIDGGDVRKSGSGDIDLIIASYDQNALLINDGNGVFEDQSLPTNYFHSRDIRLGDMNGDGYLDMVVLGEDKMSLLINDGNGSGSFTENSIKLPDYKSTPALVGGSRLQVADIDGDGTLDIMVGGSSLRVLVNSASAQAPVLAPIGNKDVVSGKSLTFNVSAEDPNGDKLLFSVPNLPSGATFDSISKLFSWVPTENDIGSHSGIRFIVKEDKPTPLQDSEDIVITVTAAIGRPEITNRIPLETDIFLNPGEITSFGIVARDPNDPTGKQLKYRWFLNGKEAAVTSSATSSLIFVVPKIGSNTIEVTVTNGAGTVSCQWNVTVNMTENHPPLLSSPFPSEAIVGINLNIGIAVSFSIMANDDDPNDTLSYEWKLDGTKLSASPTLNLSVFAFGSILSIGDHGLIVYVTDGKSAPVSHAWTLRVTNGSAYALTINASNGSVTRNPDKTTYSTGDQVALTAAPNTGYTFNSWSGDVSGTTNSTTITMNANKTATANFTAISPLTITASAGTGGSISPSGPVSVAYGTNQTFTVTPDAGYNVDQVLVDGASVMLSGGTYTFNNATTNHSIAASFTEILSINDQIIQKSFSYFWNETDNPETGFTRDRLAVKSEDRNATFDVHYNRASLAATGFQLAALCAADSDPDLAGGVTHDQLEAQATLVMGKLLDIQSNQNSGDQTTWAKWGRDGFFYHFVDIDTGERYSGSEVSTIDTAIVVAGAITAGNHFGGVLKDMALNIYRNVNWKAFLDANPIVLNHHDAANPSYNHLYHAWDPETVANGGFYGHWDYTNESLILYLLAIATPANLSPNNYAVPAEVLYTIRRELGNYGTNGNPMVKSWDGALFAYQYTQAFFNFKDASGNILYDRQGVNWWDNSVKATKANKQFCNDFINKFAGQEDLWGLTAGYADGFTYSVHGAPPAGLSIANPDGTVFPSAVTGSLPFLPDEVSRALNKMKELYDNYNYPIWGDYGFVNSFKLGGSLNDTPSPISIFYCGIDVGITLVMVENQKSGLIWDNFSNFEIASGVTLKSKMQQIAGLTTDETCNLVADDISDVSSFRMGKIDAEHTQYQVKFSLNTVEDDPYLLSVHSFMDKGMPSHVVSVTVKVNNADPFSVEFAYDVDGKDPDLMKYIPIDNNDLIVGENTITLEWQGATANARWLAWKNIEVSTPRENNVWALARNETVNPKVLFGSEYRVDDTYFVGAAISSFEQAVNKDVENFTDILFYTTTATAEYASLILKALETQKDTKTNVQIFVNNAPEPVFSGSFASSGQITTPSFQLVSGWNKVTIYHPGTSGAAPGEWIRWESISLTAANPSKFNPPQELSAASLGSDKVNLRWQVANGIDVRYNIYRSQTENGDYTKMNGAPLTSAQYQDTGLTGGASYYYGVTAYAERNMTIESNRSTEVLKVTGVYDVDYRDGRDPNSFGGASSSQFTYSIKYRHDWTDGAVRKVTLNPQESGWIGLAGINVRQANSFSIWIYGTGTEKIEVGLQNAGSGPSTFAVTASAGWQNLRIKLSDFSGISPVNLDKLSVKNTSSGAIAVFLDDISFASDAVGTATLDVAAKNVSDNSLSTGMSFANDNVNSYAPANQYLEVKYNSPGANNWKIWIYTKNDNGDSQYLGGQYNGLMSSDGRSRVALVWRVYNAVQQGGIACRTTSDVYSGANMTWNYLKDRNDSDWLASNPTGVEYSVAAFGRKNEWAYIAPVPPGLGNRNPVNNTFYVYLGGGLGSANPGDYSARIYFDITHE